MHKFVFAVAIGIIAPVSHAQVFKCSDPAGKIIFSDKACDAQGAKGEQVQGSKSLEELQNERLQAQEATDRKYQRRAAERDQQDFDERMNAERQRQAIAAQPTPPRLSDTLACKNAQKELDFVASIRTLGQNEKRTRTNAAITNVNATCGTNTPLMQEPAKILHKAGRNSNNRCNEGDCFDN